MTSASEAPLRLPHGYTNATSIQRRTVVKRYLGPDAELRRAREVNALTALVGLIPVPRLLAQHPDHLEFALVDGEPGQELLVDYPGEVLFETGRLARTLHRLDAGQVFGAQHRNATIVHGDFGPQNLLFGRRDGRVAALLDWEFAHLGDPVEDLAWAEWIVRTHHPDLVGDLGSLFDGYGRRPPWAQRQALMVDRCRWLLDFVRRWPDVEPAAVDLWRARIETTRSFRG